jgi:hypothetical protein
MGAEVLSFSCRHVSRGDNGTGGMVSGEARGLDPIDNALSRFLKRFKYSGVLAAHTLCSEEHALTHLRCTGKLIVLCEERTHVLTRKQECCET